MILTKSHASGLQLGMWRSQESLFFSFQLHNVACGQFVHLPLEITASRCCWLDMWGLSACNAKHTAMTLFSFMLVIFQVNHSQARQVQIVLNSTHANKCSGLFSLCPFGVIEGKPYKIRRDKEKCAVYSHSLRLYCWGLTTKGIASKPKAVHHDFNFVIGGVIYFLDVGFALSKRLRAPDNCRWHAPNSPWTSTPPNHISLPKLRQNPTLPPTPTTSPYCHSHPGTRHLFCPSLSGRSPHSPLASPQSCPASDTGSVALAPIPLWKTPHELLPLFPETLHN